MSWIKKSFLDFSIIIISFFLGIIIFEIFLIYENKYKHPDNIPIYIHGHKYHFLKSNSTISPLKLNQDYSELLILGDSFVEGVACAKDNANFPSHISNKLKGKLNVVNLGVRGMNVADYIDFLDHFKVSYGDVALITLYNNDLHISKRNCAQINRQAKKYDIYTPKFCNQHDEFTDKSNNNFLKKINNSIKKYKTVQLVKESMTQVPVFKSLFYRDELTNRWNDFESEENKWVRSSLINITEQVKNKGGLAVFTYYPNTNKISNNDKRHQIWMRFIEYVKNNDGIIISDPYPYFINNAPETSMVWSLTDKHPSCEAHSLMAEFIFNDLKLE